MHFLSLERFRTANGRPHIFSVRVRIELGDTRGYPIEVFPENSCIGSFENPVFVLTSCRVMAESAHPAYDKACHYFGIKLRRARVGQDFRADVHAIRRLVNGNTVMVSLWAVVILLCRQPNRLLLIASMAKELAMCFHSVRIMLNRLSHPASIEERLRYVRSARRSFVTFEEVLKVQGLQSVNSSQLMAAERCILYSCTSVSS
jgi:hypothetical protein